MLDLIWFILTTLLLAGAAILNVLAFRCNTSPIFFCISTLAIFIALIIGVSAACGLMQELHPQGLFTLALGLFLVVGLFSWKKSYSIIERFRSFKFHLSFAELSILLVLILTYVWFLGVNFYQPPYVWDVLSYHLPPVLEWTNARGIARIPFPNPRSSIFPMNFELILTYVAVFFKHDLALRFVETLIGFTIPLIVYGILKNLFSQSLSRYFCLALAISAFLSPAFLVQLNATRNDLTVNVMFLMVLYYCTLSWREGLFYPLAFAVIPAGIALGTKTTSIIVLPAMFAVSVFLLWKKHGFKQTLLKSSLVATAIAILGSPWYIRNFLYYGHPVEPIAKNINGGLQWLELKTLWQNLLELVTKLLDNGGPFTSDVPKISGYGLLFFSLTLPLLLFNFFLYIRKDRVVHNFFVPVVLLFFIELVLMLPYVTNQNLYNFRYVSWFSIFPILMVAYTLTLFKPSFLVLSPLLVLGGLVSFMLSFSGGQLSLSNLPNLARTRILQRTSPQIADYTPSEHKYYVDHLMKFGKIATQIGIDEYVYTLYGSSFTSNVIFCESAQTLESLETCIEKGGGRFLYMSEPHAKLLPQVRQSDRFINILGNLFLRKRLKEKNG